MLSYFVMAQRTISGTVISTENQQPLAGATVTVKCTNKKTTTDAAGFFKIEATEIGRAHV